MLSKNQKNKLYPLMFDDGFMQNRIFFIGPQSCRELIFFPIPLLSHCFTRNASLASVERGLPQPAEGFSENSNVLYRAHRWATNYASTVASQPISASQPWQPRAKPPRFFVGPTAGFTATLTHPASRSLPASHGSQGPSSQGFCRDLQEGL